ncbi:Aspartate transcarbamylase regulatory subunit [mine drainage metagenome]|uniref:Aspartate transcarbamylase regulatory subunit n=1 Tax=mine drainage metagenome TaxID=410659 RepID=T0ZDJ8_9ZZZZ
MSKKEHNELSVKKIADGVVIDHIEPGMALNVLKMLNMGGNTLDSPTVSILMHAPSSRMGHKDIVKVENKRLRKEEIDVISLISPRATINNIYKYKILEKYNVTIPKEIEGSIVCSNPSCITNQSEPVTSEFDVMAQKPLRIRCRYCGRDMSYDDVKEYIQKKWRDQA